MSAAKIAGGSGSQALQPAVDGLWELGGAVLIGGALGAAMAFLTGRIEPGEPSLLEAMGFVFLAVVLQIAIGSTVVLELVGPVLTRRALLQAQAHETASPGPRRA